MMESENFAYMAQFVKYLHDAYLAQVSLKIERIFIEKELLVV